jgi:hypothetical protein
LAQRRTRIRFEGQESRSATLSEYCRLFPMPRLHSTFHFSTSDSSRHVGSHPMALGRLFLLIISTVEWLERRSCCYLHVDFMICPYSGQCRFHVVLFAGGDGSIVFCFFLLTLTPSDVVEDRSPMDADTHQGVSHLVQIQVLGEELA